MTRRFRPIFRFFIFSNLFISCCAVLMTQHTSGLLSGRSLSPAFLLFVFFATLCSYSFHWWLTPDMHDGTSRYQWLAVNRSIHLILFLTGGTGAAICFLFLLPYWQWIMLGAVLTFLYSAPKIPFPPFNWLRKIAIAKTLFLSMVWVYVTTIFPLLITNAKWEPSFTLFTFSRFFLIYAICILFDLRDRDLDKALGIKSLITWLSNLHIARLFALSIIFFTAATLSLYFFNFSPLQLTALLAPGFIAALLYKYAAAHFDDMLYYFVLDGLMALSALLLPYTLHI